MQFLAKYCEKKSLHDKSQCLNTAVRYFFCFCYWQVNYTKTVLPSMYRGPQKRASFIFSIAP